MAINRISRLLTRIRNRSERGAAAVEFAIGGGLLAVMAFGSAEYGLTLQKSHTLASAVRQASRVASTPCQNSGDCKTGNRAYDDFYVLRASEAAMGEYWGQVNRIVIYKIVGTSDVAGDGGPPAACMASATGLAQPSASPKPVYCNVYTKDTTFTALVGGGTLPLLKNLSKFEDPLTNGDNVPQLQATFGNGNDCVTGSINKLSKYFCPVSPPGASTLRPRTLRNPSRVGVYIDVDHKFATGMFGSGRSIAQWDAFSLEPHPDDNSTDIVVNSPTGTTVAQYDLQLTGTGPAEALPGDTITYQVKAKNVGSQKVNGAGLKNFPPSSLTGISWTCVAPSGSSCPASGSGTEMGPITVPVGAEVVYTITATIDPTFSGGIDNPFVHTMPAGTSDPTNAPINILTDVGRPDLGITKTTPTPTVTPGQAISYTVDVENFGALARDAVITDVMPTQLTNVTWSCSVLAGPTSCPTPSTGVGDITYTGDIGKNAKLRFAVSATVGPVTPAGLFTNTAEAKTTPASIDISTSIDPSRKPNLATASITVNKPPLTVSKTASGTALAGGTAKWLVKVKNSSFVTLTGVNVTDTAVAPAIPGTTTITCATSLGTAVCPLAPALVHPLNTTVTLPSGSELTFTVTSDLPVIPSAWSIQNDATATTPAPWSQAFPMTKTQAITKLDLSVAKSAVPANNSNILAGSNIIYTVAVTANGKATGVQITDAIPSTYLTINSWKCSNDGGVAIASCATYATPSTSAAMNPTIDFAAAGTVTFTANVTVKTTTPPNTAITNTVSVKLPGDASPGASELSAGNNSSSVTHNVKVPKLTVTKTVGDTSVYAGQTGVVYTITVANSAGLGPVTGITLVDNRDTTKIASWSWTCAVCGVTTAQTGNINQLFNLTDGQTATFNVTATIASPLAAGSSVPNTATATSTSIIDSASVLSSTVATTVNNPDVVPIGKSVTPTTNVGPGTLLTYTITFKNNGPGPANGVNITDALNANLIPGSITSCSVTLTGTCGAGSITGQNVSQIVNMPELAVATVTVTATVAPTAPAGAINNTAISVFANDATTTTASNTTPNAPVTVVLPNLQFTKSNTVGNVGRGDAVWYDILVKNSGGGTMTALVNDPLPSALTSGTWKCTGAKCPAGTTTTQIGMITNQTVVLLGGESVTFRVDAIVAPGAPMGAFTNTATAKVGTVTTNATASDTVVGPDIAVTKTVSPTTAAPGQTVVYTIKFTNPTGPGDSALATFDDTVPAAITGVTWVCSATAGSVCPALSGSAITAKTFTVLKAGTVTITATGTVAASASGAVLNTATITNPAGVTDPTPGNNSAGATVTVTQPDLQITKTKSGTTVNPGAIATWTIVAKNNGPGTVLDAKVNDTADARLTSVNWTCVGGASGVCPAASGTGNLVNALVDLPASGTATFTFKGTVPADAVGTLGNTATITAPAGITDPSLANNTSTPTPFTIVGPDLQITKTDGLTTINAGAPVTYTIVVTNAGPGITTGAAVADTMPTKLTGVTWNCTGSSGAACGTASGSGNIAATTGALPVGGKLTYTVNGTVAATASGTLANSASVTAPASTTDPNTTNNVANDVTDAIVSANVSITKTSSAATYVAGTDITYIIVAKNTGPVNLSSVVITDNIPSPLTNVTWGCAVTVGTATCTSGSGNAFSQTVNMNAGSTITYTITTKIPLTAAANPAFKNTATIAIPAAYAEVNLADNTDDETDAITIPISTGGGGVDDGY
jgi:uncharacterized repeat protein (TIGR01451 family)